MLYCYVYICDLIKSYFDFSIFSLTSQQSALDSTVYLTPYSPTPESNKVTSPLQQPQLSPPAILTPCKLDLSSTLWVCLHVPIIISLYVLLLLQVLEYQQLQEQEVVACFKL